MPSKLFRAPAAYSDLTNPGCGHHARLPAAGQAADDHGAGRVGRPDRPRAGVEQRRVAAHLNRPAPAEVGILLVPDLVDDALTVVAGGQVAAERGQVGQPVGRRAQPGSAVGPPGRAVDGQDQADASASGLGHHLVELLPVVESTVALDRGPEGVDPQHPQVEPAERVERPLQPVALDDPGV